MRSFWFSLFCFALLILLVIGLSIRASAAQTNWPSYHAPIQGESKTETKTERKAELRGNRLVELVRQRGNTNAVWREGRTFPLMFSDNRKAAKQGVK